MPLNFRSLMKAATFSNNQLIAGGAGLVALILISINIFSSSAEIDNSNQAEKAGLVAEPVQEAEEKSETETAQEQAEEQVEAAKVEEQDTAQTTDATQEDTITADKTQIDASSTNATLADVMHAFVPHIAVYELKLDARADRASHIMNAAGKLVYQVSGDVCEGFATKFRFVLDFQTEDNNVLSDYRMTSFEFPGGEDFQFVSQNFTNEILDGETKGSAKLSDEKLEISLRQPAEEIVTRDKAVFPVVHTASILQAAKAGEKFYRGYIFDGAHEGTEIFYTQAVIGKAKIAGEEEFGAEETPPWENLAPWLKGKKYWSVNVTYFNEALSGNSEKEPFYSTSMKLFENGVVSHLYLDYIDFKLKGALTRLDDQSLKSGNQSVCE